MSLLVWTACGTRNSRYMVVGGSHTTKQTHVIVFILYGTINFVVLEKHVIVPSFAQFLIPGVVLAQDMEQPFENMHQDIEPVDVTVGPVGITDELMQAHDAITDIIIHTSMSTSYVDETIYYEAVILDEKNNRIIVLLDPAQMQNPVEDSDIYEQIEFDVPLEIKYGFFIEDVEPHEATSCPADSDSLLCYYWGRYVDRCLPTHTAGRCNTYSTLITQNGYPLPTVLPTPTLTPTSLPTTPGSASMGMFSDDFESGLTKWTASSEWQADTFDERKNPPAHNSANNVAEADNCDVECTLTMTTSLDMADATNPVLEFWRYVDNSLDTGEYLKVEVTQNGNTWTQLDLWNPENGDDDDTWHKETYDLTSYQSSTFQMRFAALMSSSTEDVGIDNVVISERRAELLSAEQFDDIENSFSEYSFVNSTTKEIRGGTGLIYIIYNHTTGVIKPKISNVGLVTQNGTDTVILAAGHAANVGQVLGIKYAGADMTDPLGTVTVKSYPTSTHTSSSDALVISSNSTINYTLKQEQVIRNNGTIVNVTKSSALKVGDPITLVGRYEDKPGIISYTNASVSRDRGIYFTNMIVATYNSTTGDSGGAVLSDAGSKFVGMHSGKFCEFDFGGNKFANWNVTHPTECNREGVLFAGFSAWDHIKDTLNIQ